MPKIHVLDKHVSELIAAGEVVERPSSVVKEIVENSIDAGASVITLEIKRGGITFIRVSDNGCGISRDDAPTALLRHATSKIMEADDLDSIATLGFRGEALASISAVSHMELITKTEADTVGTRLTADGGVVTDIDDAGCPSGTTIIIRDLFYNVPARMKFMKKDVTEGNSVAKIMDKIALSHPEISFRFIRDGKEILHTPGDNKLISAVYAVFGREFSDALIPVEYSLGGVSVTGFVSKPTASRPTRAMQNFFINGRYIISRTAMAALEEAYKNSIMTGKYPGCILQLGISSSSVDVNVHPAKLEVRFANERPVFDAVYHAVKSALMSGDSPKIAAVRNFDPYAETRKPEQTQLPELYKARPASYKPEVTERVPVKSVQSSSSIDYVNRIKQSMSVLFDSDSEVSKPSIPETSRETILEYKPTPENISIPVQSAEVEVRSDEALVSKTETDAAPESGTAYRETKNIPYKYVGEAFGTYIILEYGNDKLMLIDKHAAHERLIYEKIKKDGLGKDQQTLLVPVSVDLDKDEYSAVMQNLDKFNECGFEIDDFGSGSVIIRSSPIMLENNDIKAAVEEMAGYLVNNKNIISTEYMDWVYHNVACRAAIKAGDKSDPTELIALAKLLQENPDIRYCPHGRPVSIIMRKRDIEREFERI